MTLYICECGHRLEVCAIFGGLPNCDNCGKVMKISVPIKQMAIKNKLDKLIFPESMFRTTFSGTIILKSDQLIKLIFYENGCVSNKAGDPEVVQVGKVELTMEIQKLEVLIATIQTFLKYNKDGVTDVLKK